jgi:transposase-like protein
MDTNNNLDIQRYEGKLVCLYCKSENIIIYWEPRYKGFRVMCNDCNTNWAES